MESDKNIKVEEIEEKDLKKGPYCPKCQNRYVHKELGVYRCLVCGYQEKAHYAEVRTWIEKNGEAEMHEIAHELHLPEKKVEEYMEHVRKRNEKEESVRRCHRCGMELKYGNFCEACTKEVGWSLRNGKGV